MRKMSELNASDLRRFWAKVDKVGGHGPDGVCWLWLACKNGKGYGRFKIRGKDFRAHRIVYFLATGDDPHGLLVCHTCDVPGCVNPTHLFVGTDLDNRRDCMAKGRAANLKGEAHSCAKFKEEDILAMRELRADGEAYSALAMRYGTTPNVVYHICVGQSWKCVGGPIAEVGIRLSVEDVLEMRHARANGRSCAEIAGWHGKSAGYIKDVCSGRYWKAVGGPLTRRKSMVVLAPA